MGKLLMGQAAAFRIQNGGSPPPTAADLLGARSVLATQLQEPASALKSMGLTVTTTRQVLLATQTNPPTISTNVRFDAPSGNSGPIYIGDSTVSSANGIPLAPGGSVTLAVEDISQIYVVAASGSQALAVNAFII